MGLILKLGVIFTLVLFSACVSTGPKAITDQRLISQIQVDKSTEAEVTELLGLPETVSHPPNKIVWKYFYRTNLPSLPSYIPVVKVFRSDLHQETQILAVTFNQEGLVKGLECQEVVSREDSPGPY